MKIFYMKFIDIFMIIGKRKRLKLIECYYTFIILSYFYSPKEIKLKQLIDVRTYSRDKNTL